MAAASNYDDRKRAELVFIPSPGVGHLRSTVELAKLLVNRDHRLSVTVLVLTLPVMNDHHKTSSFLSSLSLPDPTRLRFVHLPSPVELPQPPPPPHGGSAVPHNLNTQTSTPRHFFASFIESHKTQVHDAVAGIIADGSRSVRIAGFVLDMFCTPMIDVANRFGVPSYVFFTSGASTLGLMFHLPKLHAELDQAATRPESDSDAQLSIPSYDNPVPYKVLPALTTEKASGGRNFISDMADGLKQAKGIMINSFRELESCAFQYLSTTSSPSIPPVYPVGPIISDSGDGDSGGRNSEIAEWLDGQPESSVVFLCFGSMGSFEKDQVREIAAALERCGCRFLWALRRPPTEDKPFELPGEFDDPGEALPEGFLGRTAGRGKVIGWAPQLEVLSHAAVGGFVSHCGWNSTLESAWCGVPVATWPMYAEQHMNAFLLTKELGLGVVVTLEYKKDMRRVPNMVVPADVIEEGIARVIAREDSQLAKVREMKEKARKAVAEGGSSYGALACFVDDVFNNLD